MYGRPSRLRKRLAGLPTDARLRTLRRQGIPSEGDPWEPYPYFPRAEVVGPVCADDRAQRPRLHFIHRRGRADRPPWTRRQHDPTRPALHGARQEHQGNPAGAALALRRWPRPGAVPACWAHSDDAYRTASGLPAAAPPDRARSCSPAWATFRPKLITVGVQNACLDLRSQPQAPRYASGRQVAAPTGRQAEPADANPL